MNTKNYFSNFSKKIAVVVFFMIAITTFIFFPNTYAADNNAATNQGQSASTPDSTSQASQTAKTNLESELQEAKKAKETSDSDLQAVKKQLENLKTANFSILQLSEGKKITISDEDAKDADKVFAAWKKVKTDLSDNVKGSFDVSVDKDNKKITVTAKADNTNYTGTLTLKYTSSNTLIWIIVIIILAIIGVSTAFYVNKKRK